MAPEPTGLASQCQRKQTFWRGSCCQAWTSSSLHLTLGCAHPHKLCRQQGSVSCPPQSDLVLPPASTYHHWQCFYQICLCFLPQNSQSPHGTPFLSCEETPASFPAAQNPSPRSLPTSQRSTGEPRAYDVSHAHRVAQQRRTHVFEAADWSCLEAVLLQVLSPVEAQDKCYEQTQERKVRRGG